MIPRTMSYLYVVSRVIKTPIFNFRFMASTVKQFRNGVNSVALIILFVSQNLYRWRSGQIGRIMCVKVKRSCSRRFMLNEKNDDRGESG